MRLLTPTILIVLALAVFFGYVDGAYEDVQELRAQEAELDEAVNRAQELLAIRDALLQRYNEVPQAELERLRKLLPDHVDNVRLTLDVDNIAAQHGILIQDFAFAEEAAPPSQGGPGQQGVGPDTSAVGVATFSFNAEATYEVLKQFLTDLEDSLRLVDVVSLSFNATDTGVNEYSVTLRTYWLR